MTKGWDKSAGAWLRQMGDTGDFTRFGVLDPPMMARVKASGATSALDVGCGDGRFCRMMADCVDQVKGLDTTARLLDHARDLGGAQYIEGRAQDLPFEAETFDLVVSYLTLIDISDAKTALEEMVRVLRPGGRLLIANLNAWMTASQTRDGGWTRLEDGAARITVDRYLEEHAYPAEWAGISIDNWHRPLAFYMQTLLSLSMSLTFFDEPAAKDMSYAYSAKMNKAPYVMMMEWQKPKWKG